MFAPRYLKHAKLLLRHTQKYLRYKSDVLNASALEEIESAMQRLKDAFRLGAGRNRVGHAAVEGRISTTRSQTNREPGGGAGWKAAQTCAGNSGIALAGKLRSHFGRNYRGRGDSCLFLAAVQDSNWLDAANVEWNHRLSDPGAIAQSPAADR